MDGAELLTHLDDPGVRRGSKRRRLEDRNPCATSFEEGSSSATEPTSPVSSKNLRTLSHVEIFPPSYPQSVCHGWEPPFPIVSEDGLLASAVAVAEDEAYIQLDDFCIYTNEQTDGRRNKEFVCLSKLSQDGFGEFLFDGTVTVGNRGPESFYVVGVPFESLMIGYDFEEPIEQSLWISSKRARRLKKPVYYQLGRPSNHYARFYDPFLWLAQFSRYFVEYLSKHEGVILRHFRRLFFVWLAAKHEDGVTDKWVAKAGLRDFRTTVTAHHGFLWKECCGIDDGKFTGPKVHPLWSEIDPKWLTAIPRQLKREDHTVVTPFTFDCFSQMYFSSRLKVRNINPSLHTLVRDRKAAFGLTPFLPPQSVGLPTPESLREGSEAQIHPGDVVCLPPDNTSWKRSTAKAWYAYVQCLRSNQNGEVMDLIWLYDPSDTTIGQAHYPFANELFMSDNCDCGKSAWPVDSAIGKITVSWYSTDPYSETGYFVRQKFRTVKEHDTYDFVKLQPNDFKCDCQKKRSAWGDCVARYEEGDCVLVLQTGRLQPALLLNFDTEKQRVIVQELGQIQGVPNELFPTPKVYDVAASRIIRRCHLGVFGDEEIPVPYNRGGVGDFYFVREWQLEDLQTSPRWGWDPDAEPEQSKLSGMGLFCGGGNFDRGIEEGGAVDFRFAIDWEDSALHSYRANAKHDVNYFLGSANDALARGLAGVIDPSIAQVGDVDFIAAGSPCQGFSNMNPDKLSPSALQNASMVASVVAYVDLYNPQYCILENVLSMTDSMGPNKDQNVFSQMIASLVAMGYQVQQWLGDAWSVGSSQNRSRLFIMASAPSLPLLEPPPQTHSHPPRSRVGRYTNLGKLTNDLTFAARQDNYTHFAHASPTDATKYLPVLGDVPFTCIQFPDHRTSIRATALVQQCIHVIPTSPPGMSLALAGERGLLTGEPLEYLTRRQGGRKDWNINAFSRIVRDGLFPTIVTRVTVHCRHTGRWLHWDEPRVITVMEGRRAQGFLDHEVIVGNASTQMKIVGNSVDRKVALVLGLSLRESWAKAARTA